MEVYVCGDVRMFMYRVGEGGGGGGRTWHIVVASVGTDMVAVAGRCQGVGAAVRPQPGVPAG
eukprot:CAMPEP_0119473324 /NCGR_PEP_ID=MMETSP1344-20130328/5031_1 /TAXON_ID=236787 /ORGANISM="Florenciella parvula, Strain CCMP2471" /LENGTH=61 /DNA_ID=CAMNT_0007506421 /DNA_START=301 /DNA_END=486 /DNA_ORIENTATION=+